MKFFLEYLKDLWVLVIKPELKRLIPPIQPYQIVLFVAGCIVAFLIWLDWKYVSGIVTAIILAALP